MNALRGVTLLGDVGSTTVCFALATRDAPYPYDPATVRVMRVADHDTLVDAATRYLDAAGLDIRPRHAVFSLPGRVDGNNVHVAHHPWQFSFDRMRSGLALESLHPINDFTAMALCLPLLAPHESVALGGAAAAQFDPDEAQTFAVVGPGTGLGVGALMVREGRLFALQTEGGHVGIAPATPLEIEVVKVLQRRFGRVSAERLLCGQGLVNLEAALNEIEGRSVAESAQAPETITAGGGSRLEHRRTLEVFCDLLGALAGDFVLGYGAWQGAWLAGGMVPHILPWLRGGGFRARFEDKGTFTDAMRSVPVRAVVHPQPGLLGAAARAMLDAGGSPLRERAARIAET